MTKLQFPNNLEVSKDYDGKKHEIEPLELYFKKGLYFLTFKDKETNRRFNTFLVYKDGKYYQVPLKNPIDALAIMATFKIHAKNINVGVLPDDIETLELVSAEELKNMFEKDRKEAPAKKDDKVDPPKPAKSETSTEKSDSVDEEVEVVYWPGFSGYEKSDIRFGEDKEAFARAMLPYNKEYLAALAEYEANKTEANAKKLRDAEARAIAEAKAQYVIAKCTQEDETVLLHRARFKEATSKLTIKGMKRGLTLDAFPDPANGVYSVKNAIKLLEAEKQRVLNKKTVLVESKGYKVAKEARIERFDREIRAYEEAILIAEEYDKAQIDLLKDVKLVDYTRKSKPTKKEEPKPETTTESKGKDEFDALLYVLHDGKTYFVPVDAVDELKLVPAERKVLDIDKFDFKKWISISKDELLKFEKMYEVQVHFIGKKTKKVDKPAEKKEPEKPTEAIKLEEKKEPETKAPTETKTETVKPEEKKETPKRTIKNKPLPQDPKKKISVVSYGGKLFVNIQTLIQSNSTLSNRYFILLGYEQVPQPGRYYEITKEELKKFAQKYDVEQIVAKPVEYYYEEEKTRSR